MAGMGAVGPGIKIGLSLWRVVAALQAVQAVAKPRSATIPAEGAIKLAFVAGAGLVLAVHDTT
jgi:hypothetical protein